MALTAKAAQVQHYTDMAAQSGHEVEITRLKANNAELVKALEFMLAYENDDEAALDEIQEEFNQQEAIRDTQEFARCYCARKMNAAIAKAGAV